MNVEQAEEKLDAVIEELEADGFIIWCEDEYMLAIQDTKDKTSELGYSVIGKGPPNGDRYDIP
jgi:hypothetical protein